MAAHGPAVIGSGSRMRTPRLGRGIVHGRIPLNHIDVIVGDRPSALLGIRWSALGSVVGTSRRLNRPRLLTHVTLALLWPCRFLHNVRSHATCFPQRLSLGIRGVIRSVNAVFANLTKAPIVVANPVTVPALDQRSVRATSASVIRVST